MQGFSPTPRARPSDAAPARPSAQRRYLARRLTGAALLVALLIGAAALSIALGARSVGWPRRRRPRSAPG
ncbi:hypothetical protein BIS11_13760, partial [Halomonas sp. 707D4]|nr:hypothetical protein [Halomonas sp. 707D4]